MMSSKRVQRASSALVAALVAALLAACGSSDGATASSTVRVATLNFPTALDPTVSSSGYDYPHLNLIYSTLLRGNPETGETEGGLAETWEIAEDGLTMTLTLRSGIQFHDGTDVDAEAVKASLERFKESANGTDIANVSEIEADGTNTVVLHFSAPDSSILTALTDRAGMIVSPTAVEKLGEDFASEPVGAGPYRFDSLKTGESVTYSRFDDYWDEQGASETLVWQAYSDPQALVTALQSDAVDVAIGIPATFVEKLKSDDRHEVVVGPAYSSTMINFNAGLEPTDDPRIRQAINLALDRDVINSAGSGDVAEVTWTALPPSHPYYDESLSPTYPRDVEQAQQLVEQATGGNRVDMKCLTFPGLNYETTGPIIIDQLAEIGIDVTIQSETAPAATEDFWDKGEAPCFLSGWTGHADPAITYGRLLNQDSYYNAGKTEFVSEQFLQDVLQTYDFDARKQAVTALEKEVVEAAPFAPLFTVPQIVGLSDDVTGYVANVSGRPDLSTVQPK